MIHLDLFSGIGGASIAVDEVFGKNNVTHIFCDNEPFAQAILKKHWPGSPVIGDIRNFTTDAGSPQFGGLSSGEREALSALGSRRPFILTGGFPCQPFSQAGRRKGTDDDRYLWPEMLRVIREFKPRWVIGENVAGLLTWDEGVVLEQVCLDLEGEGYEVQPFVIPAVALNAPHRRDRVWIVAYDERGRLERRSKSPHIIGGSDIGKIANSEWNENWLEVATRLCTLDDGLPNGLARPKGWRNAALKGAGNAWVPQVAIEILRGIKMIESKNG